MANPESFENNAAPVKSRFPEDGLSDLRRWRYFGELQPNMSAFAQRGPAEKTLQVGALVVGSVAEAASLYLPCDMYPYESNGQWAELGDQLGSRIDKNVFGIDRRKLSKRMNWLSGVAPAGCSVARG